MHLIAAEYSTDEIADELFISFHTAKTHKRNLLNKLGARNSAGLVRRAFELGILKLNQ